jgi:hypothetical protein
MDESSGNNEEQPIYHSYLLRLWQEDMKDHTWRMSLEDAHTGERRGFACLDDLFSFLQRQIEVQPQLRMGS